MRTKHFILKTKIGFYGVILQYIMSGLLKLVNWPYYEMQI